MPGERRVNAARVSLASRLSAAAPVVAAFTAAAACVVAACTTSTTTPIFAPITGIEIRAQSLVAGIGCGTGDDQVYRYAAVVSFSPEAGASTVSFTNIFDCFTDGVFENLPADNGSLNFDVAIFAYNFKDYGPADAGIMGAGLPPDLACPPGNDAAGCVPRTTPLTDAQKKDATWTALCVATQQSGVPVLAVCPPLQATDEGGISTPTDASGEASTDGSADGEAGPSEPDGATDAGDGSDRAPGDAATDAPDAGSSTADGGPDAANDG
jgi:hypothetical protein